MLRVFIADDETPARERLRELLGDLAAELPTEVVGEAQTGLEALERLPASGAQVLLLDVEMPGMRGLEVARHLVGLESAPAVVFVTAHSDSGSLDRAKLTEPFGYVIKPFEERELRTVIEIALHRHRIESALRESEDRLQLALRAASAR